MDSSPAALSIDINSKIIELIYAGNVLARMLTLTRGPVSICVCGALATTSLNTPSMHRDHCPVARFFSAVEAVKKAVL